MVCFLVGLAERELVVLLGKVENELNGLSLFTSKNFSNDVLDSQDFGLQSVNLEVAQHTECQAIFHVVVGTSLVEIVWLATYLASCFLFQPLATLLCWSHRLQLYEDAYFWRILFEVLGSSLQMCYATQLLIPTF